jgi:hypothetical protein
MLSRMLFWKSMATFNVSQDFLQHFEMCLDVEKQFSAATVIRSEVPLLKTFIMHIRSIW